MKFKFFHIAILFLAAASVNAQFISGVTPPKFVPRDSTSGDLGFRGGSGIAFLPTTVMTPESDFRVDLSRVSFSGHTLLSYSVTGGLTASSECHVEYQSATASGSVSEAFFGIGGKINLPFSLGFPSKIGITADILNSSNSPAGSLLPGSITRFGLVARLPVATPVNPHLILGLTTADGSPGFLFGSNASWPVSRYIKLGAEIAHDEFGMNEWTESAVIAVRPLSNLAVQVGGGNATVNRTSRFMASLAVSFTTAGFEFISQAPSKAAPTTAVPSFDDLQKQINEENKEGKKNNQ